MAIYSWLKTFLGIPEADRWIISVLSAVLLLVFVVLTISLFMGIAFAVFKRD